MKLIYPMLTTASLLLTASPSFASTTAIAEFIINLDLPTFVANAVACLGLIFLLPITSAIRLAVAKGLQCIGIWYRFKPMLSAILGFPVPVLFIMLFTGFMIGWTEFLRFSIAANLVFILVVVICSVIASVSYD